MSFDLNSTNFTVTSAAETYTLPGSATTEYSTALPKECGPDPQKEKRFITVGLNASAVTGTNLDIGLYGILKPNGEKVLLKDAIVADITATGLVAGQIDLNAYPAYEYYIGWTSDGDESENTIEMILNY